MEGNANMFVVGQLAFGEDIWYVDPDKVILGLKVSPPSPDEMKVKLTKPALLY
jgi:hypothetical protein